MNNWSKFWSGLNIRKAITLLFGIGFICISLAITISGIISGDKDIMTVGLTQISTVSCMCVSYYMGYSNTDKGKTEIDDQK